MVRHPPFAAILKFDLKRYQRRATKRGPELFFYQDLGMVRQIWDVCVAEDFNRLYAF